MDFSAVRSPIKISFYDTDLSGANFTGVDFGISDLRRANLETAELLGADLSQANVDYTTRWPLEFEFRGAGFGQ